MYSVSSNAVASMLVSENTSIEISNHNSAMNLYRFGKVVFMSFEGAWTSLDAGTSAALGNIPQGYRPIDVVRLREASDQSIQLTISANGLVTAYNYDSGFSSLRNGRYTACWITN